MVRSSPRSPARSGPTRPCSKTRSHCPSCSGPGLAPNGLLYFWKPLATPSGAQWLLTLSWPACVLLAEEMGWEGHRCPEAPSDPGIQGPAGGCPGAIGPGCDPSRSEAGPGGSHGTGAGAGIQHGAFTGLGYSVPWRLKQSWGNLLFTCGPVIL